MFDSTTKKPLVSIVIQTYNQKEYLEQAILSCLSQNYNNIEILVADDCSTDGTDIMMNKYKDMHNIRYIQSEVNLGAGGNTKDLLYNKVDSKYALILNHDDYLLNDDFISLAVERFSSNPNLSFVWANCKVLYEKSGETRDTDFDIKEVSKGEDYFLGYESPSYPHVTGILTTVFDVEKLRDSGFGNEKTKSQDTFIHLNLMLQGDVGFISDVAATYRVHSQSLSFNMPLDHDKTTLEEFKNLKTKAMRYKNIDVTKLDIWLSNRVFSYVFWRFTTLWNQNNKKESLKLLMEIADDYPEAYEKILNSI
ncbi:hypothetical protein N780_19400 [Pontibacillus chungwhensis BH030062]|uniref:Glycosyltransferase 2-like domain-containing protein n=2 Tax=Pontibacillus TaxID=289201 RepID=A0A0A2VCW2_9BACI|nr:MULTISPECIES: glycosyltransferase family A protein [Pontibacillus]KGP91500.1 hypothetical protein N780_19400 [Pontibacillus chungwhensis BH030062]GGD10913.1 hypothetical protein GCM10011389_18090 [Pontibacillus salipaludis]